jgi:hypothetical protein
MALTEFQRGVCRLLADDRIQNGESYIAGGAALNELLRAPRLSADLDLFHDTEAALDAAWTSDHRILESAGYVVSVVRERPSFIEAEVQRGADHVAVQWSRDSAFRFFPLVRHDDLGLTLHPFDLATNKILALVGRVEPRDFVDAVACDERVQPLGYLAWAACGKDPGFSPVAILELAAQSARYAPAELMGLAFEGPPPDAAALSRRWREALTAAREVVDILPADDAGKAVLSTDGELFRATADALKSALDQNAIAFHAGAIRGAFPQLRR